MKRGRLLIPGNLLPHPPTIPRGHTARGVSRPVGSNLEVGEADRDEGLVVRGTTAGGGVLAPSPAAGGGGGGGCAAWARDLRVWGGGGGSVKVVCWATRRGTSAMAKQLCGAAILVDAVSIVPGTIETRAATHVYQPQRRRGRKGLPKKIPATEAKPLLTRITNRGRRECRNKCHTGSARNRQQLKRLGKHFCAETQKRFHWNRWMSYDHPFSVCILKFEI